LSDGAYRKLEYVVNPQVGRGGRERGREGGKQGGREGGREGSREGGREGGREGRKAVILSLYTYYHYTAARQLADDRPRYV